MRGLGWARTLRGRVLGVVAVAVLANLAALAFEVEQFRRIGGAVETVNEAWLPLARLTARMEAQVERGGDDDARMEDLLDDARAAVLRGEVLAHTAEELAGLRAAEAQLEDVAAAHGAGGDDTGRLLDEVRQLGALAEARVAALSQNAANAQQRAVRVSLILAALGVPLGAVLLWLTGTALRPVRTLTQQVRRLEAGERPGPVDTGGDDEVGALARAFDAMARAVDERDQQVRAASAQLRQVLDSLNVAVALVEGGRVRVANPAATALWALSEGLPLPDALRALGEGRQERVVVERTEDVFVAPFGDSGRILVGEDVTDRLRDRERLVRSERLALVGQLLAQVTHEVRNPLNAMSLHAELLADELRGAEQAALVATVVDEIRRLEAVTERYLDLARRRAPELVAEDPVAMVRSVVALEEERLRRLSVTVEVDAPPCGEVEFDGNVLRRALLNLLRNAAEAGAHRVVVQVRRGGGQVEFVVRDDGPGMEPATAGRVFEPFYSTKARGTGLGLAVTRQGIEDLGGQILVESAVGEGTTFRIRVPDPGGAPRPA